MREILFRGKNEAGVWHYGAYLPYESGEVAILESFSKYGYEAVELSQRCKVIPETVGQYTGTPDKNNEKIFECDIVKAFKNNDEPFVAVVTKRNGCFWFGNWNWCEFLDKFRNYEVIGNVFDNPELVKGGAE